MATIMTTRTNTGVPTTANVPKKSVVAVAQMCSTSDKVQNLMDIATCAGWSKRQGSSMLFLPEGCGFLGLNALQTMERAEPFLDGNIAADTTAASCLTPSHPPPCNPTWLTRQLEQSVQDSYGKELGGAQPNENQTQQVRKSAQGTGDTSSLSPTTQNELSEISLLDGLQTIARASQLWISAGGVHIRSTAVKTNCERQEQQTNVEGAGENAMEDDKDRRVYNSHLILDPSGQIQSVYRKIHLFDVSIPGQVQLRESKSTTPGHDIVLCDTPIGKEMEQLDKESR